ncbi:MAG: zinc-binding dehydrogenase [Actinomycetales bacterium]|nr:zinc-binding dehydrogenase [Actinomycetales bacterium]
MSLTSRQFHLVRRPQGELMPDDLQLVEAELPGLGEDAVLVRNEFLSVDPYMRPRMNDVPSYVAPFALNAPMEGGAVGRVIESTSESLPVGAPVLHMAGWRDAAVLPARHCRPLQEEGVPLSYYLGILGVAGLTAYVGLTDIGSLKEGDSVFVSAAAGAVGSLAGQFARLLGASRVTGSAGTAEKVAHVVEDLGFDAAIDYREGHLFRQLRGLMPDGIDVYFDNVGGETLEAALDSMNDYGRVILCGSISGYQAEGRPDVGIRNLFEATKKRLRLQGFIVSDHNDRYPAFVSQVGTWLTQGDLVYRETVYEGLASMPAAMIGLLNGENIGKAVVRL